jgi:hypothetical protein
MLQNKEVENFRDLKKSENTPAARPVYFLRRQRFRGPPNGGPEAT